jgi:hypothetical protein
MLINTNILMQTLMKYDLLSQHSKFKLAISKPPASAERKITTNGAVILARTEVSPLKHFARRSCFAFANIRSNITIVPPKNLS